MGLKFAEKHLPPRHNFNKAYRPGNFCEFLDRFLATVWVRIILVPTGSVLSPVLFLSYLNIYYQFFFMAKLYRMLKPWIVLTLYSMVGAKPLSQTLETSRTLDLILLQRCCQVARSYLKSCSYILKILQIFGTVSIHRK